MTDRAHLEWAGFGDDGLRKTPFMTCEATVELRARMLDIAREMYPDLEIRVRAVLVGAWQVAHPLPTHEENTMLTTQRVVLTRLGLPEEHVENFIPGDGETVPNVTLNKREWIDMGSPEHITVVIEPGANL